MSDESGPSQPAARGQFSARAFYHWKKPGAKERHGFAMGVVTAAERTEASVVDALKLKHPKLSEFDVCIDKLEWR